MKLTIDHIQAKGLTDTSSFVDVQDPIIHINIGKIFLATEKKNNCRTDANFDAVLTADISEQAFEKDVMIEVEVLNEGTWGTKHVGRGSVGIKSAISATNQHVFFVVPLKHFDKNGKSKNGKDQGEVVLRAFLEATPTATSKPPAEKPPAAEKTLEKSVEKPVGEKPVGDKPVERPIDKPVTQAVAAKSAKTALQSNVEYDETKPLKLRIDHLQARDLKDKGGNWDKQDPALRITVGNFKPFETERVKDAGVSADFPERFELDIPAANFTNNLTIEIEAFNVGSAPFYSRTSLGKTRVPLNSLINTFNEEIPVTVDLIYESQKKGPTKQGCVMMLLILERPVKNVASVTPAIAPTASSAEIQSQPPQKQAQPTQPLSEKTVPAVKGLVSVTEPTNQTDAKKEQEVTPANAALLLQAPPGMEATHNFFVSEIIARDLKNVEMMIGDRNDPYAIVSFGAWEHRTEFIDGAGSHANWKYDKNKHADQVCFQVSTEELTSGVMKAVVNDKNKMMADKHIGSGEVKLPNSLMPVGGELKPETVYGEVIIPLIDKHGKSTGNLTLLVERETVVSDTSALKEPTLKEKESVGTDYSQLKNTLYVSKICGKGLKNVEKMYGDKNDPYIQLKFGQNTWSYKTSVIEEGGSDPVWEYNFRKDPQMKFTVSLEELRDHALGLLKVTAADKNKLSSDVLIGEGVVALPTLPGFTPQAPREETVNLIAKVQLKDKKDNSTGFIEVHLERASVSKDFKPVDATSLESQSSKKAVADGKAEKAFEAGSLHITRIVCQDLTNVENLGGKNDVYVKVQLAAEERKTETIQEGGANVCFDYLNFFFDVDKSILNFEHVNISVFDANSFTSDVLIGTASSSVSYMSHKVDEEGVQLPLTLRNSKGKESGKVILFLTLKPAELKGAPELPLDPKFQNGVLKINRVRAFDLQKQKSLVGSSHVGNPYVKLVLGSWQYKTQPLSIAAAGSPIFDNLDLAPEITAMMLQSTKLVAEVYEKGLVSDTLIGKGECSVREAGVTIGQERQFTIDLVNKGSTAGRLVVFALAAEKKKKLKKEEIPMDNSFEQGYLCIKAITAHNLKNTEFFGGKQDPYVIIEFKATGWKDRTVMLDDAGSDAHWKDLDFRCTGITKEMLLNEDFTITAMDDNDTRSDALIGTATVSAVEAAAQGVLGSDVDIEVELSDGKGVAAGRIVLQCSLHPEVAQLELSPTLAEGVLKIRKIVARGLETGNRLTRNAPSIHIQYGAWEGSTPVGDGKDPVWDFLQLESKPAVGRDVLSSQMLTVSVFDNNKKFAEGILPNLLLPGSQAGKDVDVPMELFHIKSGTSVGRLTLTLNVDKPSQDIAALSAMEDELPTLQYHEAALLVKSIKAEGLANTELIGKSDPFVCMTLGGWTDQTEVYNNSGGEVIWNDLKFREEFSADVLVNQPMEFAVYDKNKYRKNVLLGRGQLSLKRAAYSIGQEAAFVVTLQDERKKPAGKLTVTLELRELIKGPEKKLAADFKEGMLHVFRVSAFNLPNKEIIGKQDPYVVLRLGEFMDRTPTMPEAGSDPIFDLLDIKTRVTAPILENQKLEVEVWEDNSTGDILLGTGSVTLKKVTTMNEEIELRVNLKDSKEESAGRALIFARLEAMPLSLEEVNAIPISEGFERGTINVRKIAAFGLLNKDMFMTKQDPYVILTMNGWTAQTKVKDNAGENCLWDMLDMEAEVDVNALQNSVFEVKVMNKNNLRSHNEIGSGKVALRRAGAQVGKLVELSVDLVDSKSGKPAGRVVLHVEVLPEEVESSFSVPESFTFGHFKVSKISAFNLKNTEIIGLPDPFITLKLGEWSAKTYTQEDVGSDATWNYLTIGCDVMKDTLTSQLLEVTAFDENKGRTNALIGNGTVSLLKAAAHIGEEVELKVKLVDGQGKSSGRVIIFGSIQLPEPEIELPETFIEGCLKIKRVSVFGLKNSEMLGLSKGDPYMKLKLGSFEATTKVLNNSGENPAWTNLDFETTCNVQTVRVGELLVQAWEKNSIFSDKMLCSCELLIKPSGGKLGQEVELIGKLKTEKGENRGEVNVLVQLDPIAALKQADLGLPEGFKAGIIQISKIQAIGLQNKEILQGKQDPYVCVTIADWSETTDTLSNAGSSATWTNLEMMAEVNEEMLSNEKITVLVMDENTTRRDSILGAGQASLRKLCPRINSPVEIVVDLVAENGSAVGRVVLTAMLSESKPEDLNDALPVSAVVVNKAQLVIKKISAVDLRGGDSSMFGDKPDPYIQLSLENDWTGKTDVKQNAGRCATWSDISDMEVPVTGDILKYKRITVVVLDKNSMSKDTWMGKGDFSLRKLGSIGGKAVVVSHIVRLKNKRGKAAGKVIVEAELQPLPELAEGTDGAAALQTIGVLSLHECAVSKVAETAIMGKQDLMVKFALANWKHSSEVNKSAGTASRWELKVHTPQLAVAQLVKGEGLAVEVMGHSVKGDTVLGKAKLSLEKAVSQPGKWVDLLGDLTSATPSSNSVGKVRLKARFNSVGDDVDLGFPTAGPGNQNFNELKTSQADLHTRVGMLEASIKAQLQEELAAERDSILKAMAKQNKALSESIEGLSKELLNERKAKAALLDGLVVNQVNALKLPTDVKQWRSAHVQAWISFQMELPQYSESFQKASVDGLILVKHINRDTLQNSLDITDPMHCQKILEGVQVLQARQKEVDAHAEADRLKRLQAKKEEEERKRAAMAELKKQNDKKAKKDSKTKKKKKTKVEPKTYFGEVREQNVLERARIEREMRLYRTEKQKLQDRADIASRTWKFEYTGAPQPKAETIWDSDPFAKSVGTSAYRRTMALDVLRSDNFATTGTLPRAPASIKLRPVPSNSSSEEVLALVKGAMFDLSEWLLEMYRIERRREAARDSDLADINDNTINGILAGSDQMQNTEKYDLDGTDRMELAELEEYSLDDPSQAPPPYEELVSSKNPSVANVSAADTEDYDDEDEALPAYEDVVSEMEHAISGVAAADPPSPVHVPNTKLKSLLCSGAGDLSGAGEECEPERMTLIFNALVGQKNNNAKWLGANEKLTRMKLYGGFESLLRLKIEWTLFDALWTQLDYKRSGDIDLREFTEFFGDLGDFKNLMGTQSLSTTAKSKSIVALSKCLYELCDALRNAGFTVVAMFSGFDRNGSGEISISEFCSMLRLVVGNHFEKRLIYQALCVLDTNGDKAISLEEVLRFVYRIWKTQLDELADKLGHLDENMTGEAEKIQKIIEERRKIKEAVKRNFPREWRDRLEREGGHAVPGPFQALLQRMGVGTTTANVSRTSPDHLSTAHPNGDDIDASQPSSPQRAYRPSETWSPSDRHYSESLGNADSIGALFTASAPLIPRTSSTTTGPRTKMTSKQLSQAGQNEIMRFKIKVPAGSAPTRPGATLQVPRVTDLNASKLNSSEETDALLRKNAPFEGYG